MYFCVQPHDCDEIINPGELRSHNQLAQVARPPLQHATNPTNVLNYRLGLLATPCDRIGVRR